jgi:hypothetical protein
MNDYIKDKQGRDLYHAANWDDKPFDHNSMYPTMDDIACELQLNALGDWVLLNFKLDPNQWETDQKYLEPFWRPFQPREGILNDRESILIYGMEGDNCDTPTGLAQYKRRIGYVPDESEMKFPTEARPYFKTCDSVFDYFNPMSRTFIVKLNAGGFYPRHRDFFFITRKTFRLIAFLGDSSDILEWEVDGRVMHFQPNRVYYVNTMKMHRLSAWRHNATMVVFNVDKTWENVMRVTSAVEHV